MFVSRLACTEPDCGASFDVYSAERDHGLTACQFCGGSLMDASISPPAGQGGDDLPPGKAQVVITSSPIAGDSRDVRRVVEHDLADRVNHASHEGQPTLFTRMHESAVLVGAVEFERLVRGAELVVELRRSPAPDTWRFTVEALGVSEWGFGYDEGIAKLLVTVRRCVRRILGDPMEAYPRRDLALRLWLADAEWRLPELLANAVALQDERVERIADEHGD